MGSSVADAGVLGFALAAGLVAAVNPCGFAMLPGYLALVVNGEASRPPGAARVAPVRTAVARALTATAAMTVGFLLVFSLFGLVIAPLTSSIEQYLPVVTVLVGGGLVGLGCWLLTGREFSVLLPRPGRGAPSRRLGSMFGYGIAYALASLSCTIAPFLAVTTLTFRTDSVLLGAAVFVVYGLGMAILVGVLAVAIAVVGSSAAGGLRRAQPWLNRMSGALLIATGLYVGYYGIYEWRLFVGDVPAGDAIVDGAGALQAALAGWIDTLGVLPFATALGAALLAVAAAALLSRRRRAGRWR